MQASLLPDGRRLHLQDGPIDLIVEAFADRETVEAAYRAAVVRLDGLLDELCGELTALRAPVSPMAPGVSGPVAKRMAAAVAPYGETIFITPMAAVAGSVADEILCAMREAAGDRLVRAYVNNGGDIALHLSPGKRFTTGLVDRPDRPSLFATADITAEDGVGGIATSGARGRSFSLGIADAVTILAASAAEADAAATVVANAVDLDHPGIVRVPARELAPDSDLGERRVTTNVPALTAAEIDAALARGEAVAGRLVRDGRIFAAALHLQGVTRIVGRSGGAVGMPSLAAHGGAMDAFFR